MVLIQIHLCLPPFDPQAPRVMSTTNATNENPITTAVALSSALAEKSLSSPQKRKRATGRVEEDEQEEMASILPTVVPPESKTTTAGI